MSTQEFEFRSADLFPFIVTTLDLTAPGLSRERYIEMYAETRDQADECVSKLLADPETSWSEPLAESNPLFDSSNP